MILNISVYKIVEWESTFHAVTDVYSWSFIKSTLVILFSLLRCLLCILDWFLLQSSTRTLVYLILKTNFFLHIAKSDYMEDLYKFIGGLLVKHHCQAQINNILLSFPNYCLGFGVGGRWMSTLAGKAICPTIALLNHSCSPNAVIM